MSQVEQVLTDGSAGKGKDIGKGILVVTPAELFVYFISNFLFYIFGDLSDCRCIKAPSYLLNVLSSSSGSREIMLIFRTLLIHLSGNQLKLINEVLIKDLFFEICFCISSVSCIMGQISI